MQHISDIMILPNFGTMNTMAPHGVLQILTSHRRSRLSGNESRCLAMSLAAIAM